MDINVYDLTEDLDDSLRDYATKRLSALSAHALPITSASVQFYHGLDSTRSASRQRLVSITLFLAPPQDREMSVHSTGYVLRDAFDQALTHLDQQLLHLADAPA